MRDQPQNYHLGRWIGAGARSSEVTVSGRLVSVDFVVLRTAAEQGLGIARLPGLLAHGAIQAGRLVPLLEDQAPPPTPVELVLPGGTRLPARTRAFIDFVQPRLAEALASAGLVAGSRLSPGPPAGSGPPPPQRRPPAR